jgi:cytoskeletal protein CcmA (bactofilin family)
VWNKTESENEPSPSPPPSPSRSSGGGKIATLGPSIVVKGSLSGGEDMIVRGTVEGEITLRKHNVTVAEGGRVKADIRGRNIAIEGQVIGNLFGEEQVVIRQSGQVEGNLTAPRVTLENGAKFRGSVDMQPQPEETPSAPKPRSASSSGGARDRSGSARDNASTGSGSAAVSAPRSGRA